MTDKWTASVEASLNELKKEVERLREHCLLPGLKVERILEKLSAHTRGGEE